MRFAIEILRADERTHSKVLFRSAIEGISPKWAKTKAATLLDAWRNRGANGVRILNRSGEELYCWRE
jgi:hypothetical protein